MTIVEAIVAVLSRRNTGLTAQEVYQEIVDQSLYTFGAKHPINVVNGEIRRRCRDLDFPTAFPNKLFYITSYQGKKPCFALITNDTNNVIPTIKPSLNSLTEQLPEEQVTSALQAHYSALKQLIIERIMANTPGFFEHLVMDLLLKMGYGYDHTSGIVTGRSHDGGIDGMISEDKLGLGQIYIQAKRYTNGNNVGRRELQAFVGAMVSAQKGVFITTSAFTKEAIAFVERQQLKSIRLIDGEYLAELLLKHEVGISVVKSFSLYKIDSDYYG